MRDPLSLGAPDGKSCSGATPARCPADAPPQGDGDSKAASAQMVAAGGSTATDPPATKDEDLRKGDFIGEFEILEFVAAGGMGEVYKVKGKYGGKRGALKRIRKQFIERADFLERFETEARILADLEHKYIVQLLYAGMHEGNPYFVMEWLDGVTLRDFMNHRRRPRLDLADALHYAICIAEALCAAHAGGVLHRDLKPENVFMLKKGKLKLLDFGLGRLTGSNRVSTSERLGAMGTPHYSAPELLARTGVDERSDIYSLALIFVEMATGRYAFSDASGVLPPGHIATANQILATPNSLRELPNCTESLAALIDSALDKDKTKRPASTEFLAALRRESDALSPPTQVATGALDDEDSADEPAPPAPPAPHVASDPVNEAALVRHLPKVLTDLLPGGFEPQSPSSTANPMPLPARTTVKMPPPAAPARTGDQPSSDRSSVAESTWTAVETAAEITNGGRSATLPPAPAMFAAELPAGAEPPAGHVPVPTEADAKPSAMPSTTLPAQPLADDSPAARASLEFANRPTDEWTRPAPPNTGTVSATPVPMHRGPQTPLARPRIPVWAGLLVGPAVVVCSFGIAVAWRGHGQKHLGDEPRASASVTAVGAAPTSPTETPPPATQPPEPLPASTILASQTTTSAPSAPEIPRTALRVTAPKLAPTAKPALPAAEPPSAATNPEPMFARPATPAPSTRTRTPAAAVATVTPPPAAPPASTPTPVPEATAAPHRIFGLQN